MKPKQSEASADRSVAQSAKGADARHQATKELRDLRVVRSTPRPFCACSSKKCKGRASPVITVG
jgi:hypothetical protein